MVRLPRDTGLGDTPEDDATSSPDVQLNPRVIQQSADRPSSPAYPECIPGAAPASTSAASGSNPPLRFTCRGSDGTIYQMDSHEDELLFQRLEENAIQFGNLIDVSAQTATLDLLQHLSTLC